MFPPLLPSRVVSVLASNELELQLRELSVQHREVSSNDFMFFFHCDNVLLLIGPWSKHSVG